MTFSGHRRKGMELAMNTVVVLVVLLVVLLILLVLVSRSGDKYMEIGEEKIETGGSVTNCGIS
ncbi:MAG: hypothetical protein U9P44_02975, partial [archaeon]|nr:hypothetical protein [archaeon]